MIRDHNGHVRRSSIQSLTVSFSFQITKAVAIFRGLVLAVNSGLLPLVVESSTKAVIDMINSGVAPQADIGVIIHDILSLLSKFPISISFVSRRANIVAHSFAKLAIESVFYLFWFNLCLPSVESFVLPNLVV
ncbi:hypothetical protein Ddye_020736 [Dipteronia dyeriana]|uniref:RNase H type-1 domain-containing protein n=1 Tax=Dipteronia dyeriana TaxID=168575 RepID=A0AAD9WW96_9ROSI|nr:hypothetical protein Ddye_020736 [Dipteronia dyeriana]